MRSDLGMSELEAYRAVFWAYAVFGLIKLGLTLVLSEACEAETKTKLAPVTEDPETAPLLVGGNTEMNIESKKKSGLWSLLPDISAESRVVVANLCFLLALDNFSSALVPV